jgi:hypothetical protein
MSAQAPARTPIVISADPTASGAQAYHRDFPEIRARGRTPVDATEHLVNELTRMMDSALTPWRREAIERALADARACELSLHQGR